MAHVHKLRNARPLLTIFSGAPGAPCCELSSVASPQIPGLGRGRGRGDASSSPGGPPAGGASSPRGRPPAEARRPAQRSGDGGFSQRPPNRDARSGNWTPRGRGGQHQRRDDHPRSAPARRGDADLPKQVFGKQWVAEVPAENSKEVTKYNLEDLFDTSALLNTEMLPLMRYIISEEEMARFTQGRMSADEQERFMAKLQSSMLRSSEESAHAHAAKLRVESEPNYAVEDVLFNTPQANQPPVPSAGDAMEALKAELVSTYGMSEEEVEELEPEAVADLEGTLSALLASSAQGQEDELLSLVNDAVPQDHPHYAAIKSRVQVLLGNPGWPQERKLVFARRLIKHLA